ncbi:MAG: helix-turn-helix domain-containing protein [Pseudomonadota bacterium]
MSEIKSPTEVDQLVGQMIRARRRELGLTQHQLGEFLYLTFQQVQKYERGVNRISAGRLYELSVVLGVGIEYFYEGAADLARHLKKATAQGKKKAMVDRPVVLTAEAREIGQLYMQVPNSNLRKQLRASMQATVDALTETS